MKLAEKSRDKSQYVRIIIIILIPILVISAIYLFYIFNSKSCEDETCFISAIEHCQKASWLKEEADSVWMLRILGKEDNNHCRLYARLVNLRSGALDSEKLIGKDMTCIVLNTETSFPSSDMAECTGILKEEIQDIIIKRMHDYILSNIGEIKEEFGAI
ncbi:MAG: hypothetical protein PHF67_00605 [Candidatus Nanoarchaeia archaeon]|nr:hypothetical protein [Candidatus Nanoarchaeia archaeon]